MQQYLRAHSSSSSMQQQRMAPHQRLVVAGRSALLRRRVAVAAAAAKTSTNTTTSSSSIPQLPQRPGPVICWFKHDLRLSDHPGLLAAAQAGAQVVPVFCLDPRLYSPLALQPGGVEALHAALHRLAASLADAGSGLVCRVGAPDAVLPQVAAACGAQRIVAEREEESRWLEAGHRLAAALPPGVAITTWQAPVWSRAGFSTNFRAWRKSRGRELAPLPAPPPGALGALPDGLVAAAAAGAGVGQQLLPSLEELRRLLGSQLAAGQAGRAAPHSTAEARDADAAAAAEGDLWSGPRAAAHEQLLAAMMAEPAAQPHAPAAAQLASLLLPPSQQPAGAADSLLSSIGAAPLQPDELLAGYLQSSDGGTATDARLQFLAPAIAALEGPAAPGASFPALLGPLLQLGVLSAREAQATASRVEAARWGGRMPLLGPSTTAAKAALSAVELADFHRALAGHIPQEGDAPGSSSSSEPVASASASLDETPDGVQQWGIMDLPRGVPRRCSWRWRGALTDYCVVEPAGPPRPGAPAVVLLHGFGAFGDQWRFNLAPLAAAGYTVYAPTLPGFGRSEKAALRYSQNAWRDFMRDFLVGVVGRPAVVAGNSIGGFIAASAAADYPSLVAGLVLVNSAGPITPGITPSQVSALESEVRRPPPALVVKGATWALMAYLQNSIGKQLRWLYPTNPGAADAWLEGEIYRAACDSRSADVFASVFYLPKPRPLNHLINHLWRGPTAVVQGVLDPLNDAKGRADLLASECPGLRVWEINAGHCPHDEAPEAVNAALLEFVEQMVLPAQAGTAGSGSVKQQQAVVAQAN